MFRVCVRCFTYNHSSFISDALDGFCKQNTSFPFVCLIVDDASSDGTQQVIDRYLKDFFLPSRRVEETDNYKMIYVQHRANNNCFFAVYFLKYNHHQKKIDKLQYLSEWIDTAEYMALCEGDDYWTNATKLQRQVEYLDNNKKCVLVYTDLYVVDSHSKKVPSNKPRHFSGDCLYQLVRYGNFIMTVSVCYRIEAHNGWRQFREGIPFPLMMGDYPDWIYIATKGDIGYIDEETVAYRLVAESASHSKDINHVIRFARNELDIRLYCNDFFHLGIDSHVLEKQYYKTIIRFSAGYDKKIFIDCLKEGLRKFPVLFFSPKVLALLFVRCVFQMKL